MKLTEMVDEFENVKSANKSDNVNQLFRAQKSACHVLEIFVDRLIKLDPFWWRESGESYWDVSAEDWATTANIHFPISTRNFSLPRPSDLGAKQIRASFKAKYNAMKKAKEQYEKAGGDYGEYNV